MKSFQRFTCFLLLLTSLARGESFQVNFNVGQDNPDSGEERTSGATLFRFGLMTEPSLFRFSSAFTYLMGSGQFSQGELALGPYIYPLADITKSRVQPFVFVEGVAGFGTLADTTRTDAGFGMGAGVDWRWGKNNGLTIAVEQHAASETATRLWIGYFWR